MKNKLIGLCGYKGSGKTMVARQLNAERVSFAEPMRAMMECLVDLNELFEKGKEAPLESLNGKSYRYALQTLGTEWGRGFMGEDFWCKQTMSDVRNELRLGMVVVDDVRFDNEAKAIREAGGIVVNLVRKSIYTTGDSHASEGGILPEFIDEWVDNTGKIEDTVKAILAL